MGKGYTQADLPRDISERFGYMTALITANEGQVEACREFIRKYCDPEYLEVYDIYWAGNDQRRMEKIVELQEMSLNLHEGKETEHSLVRIKLWKAQHKTCHYQEKGKHYGKNEIPVILNYYHLNVVNQDRYVATYFQSVIFFVSTVHSHGSAQFGKTDQ